MTHSDLNFQANVYIYIKTRYVTYPLCNLEQLINFIPVIKKNHFGIIPINLQWFI